MRRREVEQITGMGRSSIYRLMQDGVFPRPVRVGPAAVRWAGQRHHGLVGVSADSRERVWPAPPCLVPAYTTNTYDGMLLCRLPLWLARQEVRPQLHQCAASLEEVGPGVGLFGRIA